MDEEYNNNEFDDAKDIDEIEKENENDNFVNEMQKENNEVSDVKGEKIEKTENKSDNKEEVNKSENKNKEILENDIKSSEYQDKPQKTSSIPQYRYHYINQKCKVNPVKIPKTNNDNKPIQKSFINNKQNIPINNNQYYFDETETRYLYQQPKKIAKTSQDFYTTSFSRKKPSPLYLPHRTNNTFKLNKLLQNYYQDYSKLSKRHTIIPKTNYDEVDYYPEM